jgi:N-acyl-D-amino-acid deacylase
VTLSGGRVADGSGNASFIGNVIMAGGLITSVGRERAEGEVIDVSGCVVAPGFIDIHSHVDWLLGFEAGTELLAASLEQGITTAVVGNCGLSPAPLASEAAKIFLDRTPLSSEVWEFLPCSWGSVAEYLAWVEAHGLALNIVFLVGHSTLRCGVLREPRGMASRQEVAQMAQLLATSIDQGASGMSVGLEYFPGRYAPPSELLALARVVAASGTVLAAHTRGISGLYAQGMAEILDMARRAGCRLQVSHVNPMGKQNWANFSGFREQVSAAAKEGLDVGFDAVAYTGWGVGVVDLLPHVVSEAGTEAIVAMAAMAEGRSVLRDMVTRHLPAWPAWLMGAVTRNQLVELGWDNIVIAKAASEQFAHFEGWPIARAAAERGVDPFDCYCDWVAASAGMGRALAFGYAGDRDDETALELILKDPDSIPETDTVATRTASGHLELTLPLFFGTMPRFVGHFSRDRELFSLDEAVRRVTSAPAERFRLRGRGLLKPGYRADVTVFDPEAINDAGSFLHPRRPKGIEYVFVNGVPVVQSGLADLSRLPGEVLRRPGRWALQR